MHTHQTLIFFQEKIMIIKDLIFESKNTSM